MPREVVVLFAQAEGKKLIEKHCRRIALPPGDLRRLVEEVISKNTMQRRHGLWQAFDEVLDQTAGAPVSGEDRAGD
jgi:hypothetical protein